MCNLYRMTRTADEVAGLFGAINSGGSNAGGEVYPGYPGLVIREAEGARVKKIGIGSPSIVVLPVRAIGRLVQGKQCALLFRDQGQRG